MQQLRFAFFGGIYSNWLALEAALENARSRGVDQFYCLGDLGAFGPHPDRVFPLLQDNGVLTIQGNYDQSIGEGLDDCQCGYTDPRDNHFAQLSYEYTQRNTSPDNCDWLRELPKELRLNCFGLDILLCHGSPRKTNEFIWESTTSTPFLERLCEDFHADIILGTHTGIHWERKLNNDRRFINVGALGRPANDGRQEVWYTLLELTQADGQLPEVNVEFVPVSYDWKRLAEEMSSEQLPVEFIETISTGWWTTCLEILPVRERLLGRH